SGLRVMKDFGPLQYAPRLLRVRQFQNLIAKCPVREIACRITTHATHAARVVRGPVLPKPVKDVTNFQNAAAMRLYVPAAVIRPDLARSDDFCTPGRERRCKSRRTRQ